MLRKEHVRTLLLCSIATIAGVAGWSVGGRDHTANAAESSQRLASEKLAGEARIPADVLNQLIYEQVEAAKFRAAGKGDSTDGVPTYYELQLTCDGEVILIWWTNEDGSTGWDAECCDDC